MSTSMAGSNCGGNLFISLVSYKSNKNISDHLFVLNLQVEVLPPNLLKILILHYMKEALRISRT